VEIKKNSNSRKVTTTKQDGEEWMEENYGRTGGAKNTHMVNAWR
jgi:hypothetical protein